MRNRERTWDGGARVQFICHRLVVLLLTHNRPTLTTTIAYLHE